MNVSFQDELTNVFNAQNFSVSVPAHSGLVLNLGTTDYFLRHSFQLDAFIERCGPVFESDVENLVIDNEPGFLGGFHGWLPCRIQPIDVLFKMPVLDLYVVHLSNWAFSVLAYILGTCIQRERGGCETNGQDNSLRHTLFTSCDIARVTSETAHSILFNGRVPI